MSKLLRKYFLLAVMIVLLFVALGIFLNNYVASNLRAANQKQMLPPLFLAKIVDNLNAKDKIQAVRDLESWNNPDLGRPIYLLSAQAEILYSRNSDVKIELPSASQLAQLEQPYDYFYFSKNQNEPKPPVPFMPPLFSGGPPAGQGGGGDVVIKLAASPAQYLFVVPSHRPKPPGGNILFPWLGAGLLILSLLIGIGTTLFIIYISIYKKIREADDVISEIRSGNLKARFKVVRKDEFGEAMVRFNKMADEIEKLVEHLKFVELSRTKLLQELAHDLRTPIASLKSLLETLQSRSSDLEPSVRAEILDISVRETEYFAKLVEDLLLLSQVSEPKYGAEHDPIDMKELLIDSLDSYSKRAAQSENPIVIKKHFSEHQQMMIGNHHLLSRMIRNLLENAISFSKSSIDVTLESTNGWFQIIIEDDGPGFSTEQIKSYGLRKLSREMIANPTRPTRLSIGLGSVIVKKICELHHGELIVENLVSESLRIEGARIILRFPAA